MIVQPSPVDLMGIGEAAALLGVSKQRVHQLARRDDFPKPVVRLAATPVWAGEDIRRWAGNRHVHGGCPTCRCGPAQAKPETPKQRGRRSPDDSAQAAQT